MTELLYKHESFEIIGACMDVHNQLGKGFDENVYKDALEIEFQKRKDPFEREKRFDIYYDGIKLKHFYFSDYVVFEKIILEIKAIQSLTPSHIKQTLNYLAASKLRLGILVNFGEDRLKYERVIL